MQARVEQQVFHRRNKHRNVVDHHGPGSLHHGQRVESKTVDASEERAVQLETDVHTIRIDERGQMVVIPVQLFSPRIVDERPAIRPANGPRLLRRALEDEQIDI